MGFSVGFLSRQKPLTLRHCSGKVRGFIMGSKMSEKQPLESMSFEQALLELENIVGQMEQGDIPLEQALENFERGVQLARHSQGKLSQAEQKVKILMSQQADAELQDFDDQQ